MKKLVFALIMAILFFVLLNFIYCNLDGAVFGYRVVFKFSVPYLLSVQSVPLPMGFVVLLAFSSGMVAIALLEALPSFFKTLEIRSKNRKIRQLERELNVVRQLSDKGEGDASATPSSPSGSGVSS